MILEGRWISWRIRNSDESLFNYLFLAENEMEAVDDEVAVAEAVGDPVPLNSIA